MLPCPDYWIGFYFPSYGAKWKKKHTLSLLLKFLERGTFDICCLTEANYYPGGGGGALPGGQGGWEKLCCCFSSISDMCFKYCANAVTVILNINLMYWQGGYNDITMHLV